MKLTQALGMGSQSFAQRVLGSWVPGVASALAHRLLSPWARSWPEEDERDPGLRAEPCEIWSEHFRKGQGSSPQPSTNPACFPRHESSACHHLSGARALLLRIRTSCSVLPRFPSSLCF